MTDHVIVTLCDDEGFEADMELPEKIPLSDLAPQLLENLKAMAPQHFSGREQIRVKFRDRLLEENETLERAYVWDGSVLCIV